MLKKYVDTKKWIMKTVLAAATLMSYHGAAAYQTAGNALPQVSLSGDLGGLVSGKTWDSEMLKGKVQAIFYVDPDERDANELLKEALKKAAFPDNVYQSTVIINMDATAIPNFILSGLIESSQEENPKAVYVEDLEKTLIKKWNLPDDAFNVLILDKTGKVLLAKTGSLKPAEVQEVVSTIASAIRVGK